MNRVWIPLALLALLALLLRPPVPLDETRYLAVAWEMHLADAWLVPQLDGQPYHHKPPLLFWLTRVGWEVFGVHAWWPRLLPLIAALLTGIGAMRLASRFAPQAAHTAREHTAILLAGCLAWPVYASVLLFDLLVAAWAVLGWHALLDRQQRPVRAAFLLACAIAGGVLTKGPVILVYLVPPMLLLPGARKPRAIAASLAGLALGAAGALVWALPAAAAGGEAYGDALLYGQTAGRLRSSFSHDRPFWWYLPIALALTIPWSLWPRFWAQARARTALARRALASIAVSFLVFCFISGKQPHYLAPMLPPLFAALAPAIPFGSRARRVPALMCASLALALTVTWTSRSEAFDLEPTARVLAELQDAELPVAQLGDSHGQFSFLGRLKQPLKRVGPGSVRGWSREHAEGWVVLIEGAARRAGVWTPEVLAHARLQSLYRSESLALVPAAAIAAEPPSFEAAIAQSRALFTQSIKDGIGPGISVAVGHAGKVIWAEGFGYAQLADKRPVTIDTQFRIGSVSKPITAVGLMRLVQNDKLDLDADVRGLVPEFPEKRWPVTVRQLAGHLGGIRHYRGAEFLSRKPYPTVRDGLTIFVDAPLLHEPGTRYAYSSYGWNLLSAAMESAAKQPFLEFMQAQVFDPLKLTATTPDWVDAELPHRTAFYQMLRGKPIPAIPVDNSDTWAGGGYLSTPSDIVRFQFGVEADGYLSEATRKEMWTPLQLANGSSTGYGIGWTIRDNKRFGPIVGHSGSSVGGVTMFESFLAHSLVVAVTINNSEGPAGRLARQTAIPFLEALLAAEAAEAKQDED